ncbi:MAG: metallophosphoesterase [Mycoplasmatales bacterium]
MDKEIIVFSDVHANPEFVDKIKQKDTLNQLDRFFLGDMFDRGDKPFETLIGLVDLLNLTVILGNHDQMLYQCLLFDTIKSDDDQIDIVALFDMWQRWNINGGRETMISLFCQGDDEVANAEILLRICNLFSKLTDALEKSKISLFEEIFEMINHLIEAITQNHHGQSVMKLLKRMYDSTLVGCEVQVGKYEVRMTHSNNIADCWSITDILKKEVVDKEKPHINVMGHITFEYAFILHPELKQTAKFFQIDDGKVLYIPESNLLLIDNGHGDNVIILSEKIIEKIIN